jgi:hypothetical protein
MTGRLCVLMKPISLSMGTEKLVQRSQADPLRTGHLQQTVKHPPKKMFWGCFISTGPGNLIPIEGMMISEK